jgi:auxin efflux carrier family protein
MMGSKCSVPLTLVVLGAYFHVPDESKETKMFMQLIWDMRKVFHHCKNAPPPSSAQENQMKPNLGETKTVILAVASRMILTPLLLIPGLALVTKYGWHEGFVFRIFFLYFC